ncbi:hypothetical protein ASPZODRAFT_66278 [Penicilliopsis zonata CBS 506.65]|uniref:Carboxylesterase type B domain-containing protein n=1 Tax=Penicilliopsis zonata CBS 506.65 TaxID=1073090 RepID=A0A1L9SH29_9EURO|nr:hypothetical protein ASPZODRAFT_66278 [Penicilliopsis zonata CBS 506.65]OJJ46499.1 hypothetical protein ASPZODRAFT_66278 [Penicilliopsis zonata CBS 506.65]
MPSVAFFIALGLLPAVALATKTVDTANGEIVGHVSSSHAGVVEYLGIPFAQPPVGSLRFEAPAKRCKQVWNDGLDGLIRMNSDCPYTLSSAYSYPDEYEPVFTDVMKAFVGSEYNRTQSEDCLTLNVWANNDSDEKKPVYVHFYGGRYTSGATNTPFYSGADLASTEDVIVVTANYRMNVFGFPGIPDHSSNLGLLDQRAAVEWVRDNIAAFGGDASRIVISGQSCGSAMVDYWAYAWPEDPIVAGIISHSGTSLSFEVNSADLSAQHWADLTGLLGCNTTADALACMKEQTVADLLAMAATIAPPASTSAARKQPSFEPTVDNVTIFADYVTLADSGKFARVPYLVGHNDNEAGFYKIAAYLEGANLTAAEWLEFEEETFVCPSDFSAAARIAHGVPSWRFRYFADWNNTRLYPTSGAYHGVDLNMVFGNSALYTDIPESDAQLKLQAKMQAAWAAFIANPTAGLTKLGFPEFDLDAATLISLGYNNEGAITLRHPSEYNAACSNITL